jgi:hypothetical protein
VDVVDAIPLCEPVECCNICCAIVSDDPFNCFLVAEDLLKDECADHVAGLDMKGMPLRPSYE